ncbi:MAG: ATP-binding protein [Kofleriaceae bacterium]
MNTDAAFQRLLQHAQRLFTLSNPDDILAATCHEIVALTGATRAFASCSLPRQPWEQGIHLACEGERSQSITPPARSALFALHRRLAQDTRMLKVAREDAEPVFAGLACTEATLHVVPIVHRAGRLWGELVLIGATNPEAPCVLELAQHTTAALENAQRLAFARRDQDRLLLLAEATEDALYDWDIDGGSFWWGGGIFKLIGSDGDTTETTPRWKLDQIHPDDLPGVEASFDEAQRSEAMTWQAEYRFRRHDASYFHIEDRGYFLRDVGGRAYRMIGSMRDVTAMRALLAREQQARSQAESGSRAKDEFLAMLGHELRNPLAPIVTGLELLRSRGNVAAARELAVLERQAQHLIRLVDDLLDISRITNGTIELKREPFEISQVVVSAIETVRPLVEGRSHLLDVKVPPRGLEVYGDRARLAQAIGNLLNNAAKYTEPGGRIAIRAARDGDVVSIVVRDTGIGIEPGMLPHIFSRFVQERQALDRSQGGLGLGLCIVKSIVELHGGTVEVKSAGRGHGSELTIRIPATITTRVSERPLEQPIAKPRATGCKIMVVDDNEDAADMLSILLEQLGNTTRVAHDAFDALRIVEEFSPDLAVLDIGLPVMDGYELARRIRQRPSAEPMALVALTGYGQPSDKETAAQAGFDAHLVKPIGIDALEAVIARLTRPQPS